MAATPAESQSPAAEAAGGPTVSALRVQAQELAGEIQAEGRTLDELAGEYNVALTRYQQLHAQEKTLTTEVAATTVQVGRARDDLREQAIIDYVSGGSPMVGFSSGRAGADPSLTVSYAEIVATGQQRALQSYRSALSLQTRQKAQLHAAAAQAAVVLTSVRSDQQAAQATLAARQRTLGQITGQIAVLVAQIQLQQAQAEQKAVEASLRRQGHSAPGSQPAARPTSKVGNTESVVRSPARSAPTGQSPSTRRTTSSTRAPLPVVTAAPTTAAVVTTQPVVRTTSPPTIRPNPPTTQPGPPPGGNVEARGASIAIAYARAQIGKPYVWGGAGPSSFDCSGLVMMAWEQAGVYFPHYAQSQYNLTERIPLWDLLPGDLVFYGTPTNVFHVGLYIGGGVMIDAPETGETVHITSIYWGPLLGGGRVR